MKIAPVARAVAVVVLALHLAAGIAALVLAPRGFALDDVHFWSHTVVPATLVVTAAVALARYLFFRSTPLAVTLLVAAAAGGWVGAVTLGAVLFPISMPLSRCVVPAGVALWLLVVARFASERAALPVVAVTLGGGLGALEIYAQRAPEPSTRPAGGTLAEVRGPASSEEAATGQLIVACGTGKIRLNPVLSFHSRSPDRTWSLLAPPGDQGARRALEHYAKTPNGFRASYTDDGKSSLVVARDKRGILDIDAMTELSSAVYSHLNTWTTIHLAFDASISFGPTDATRFPIEAADYPSGRPTKLAYVAPDLSFRVVRAADAEKGPYTELAAGRLARDEALVIDLWPRAAEGADKGADKERGCRLVFKDWSAQISTEPSPTAGWRVPQNSIQFFSRDGEALVVLALAETGPGRGYDTVGHAAGVYRNRMRVEPIPEVRPR